MYHKILIAVVTFCVACVTAGAVQVASFQKTVAASATPECLKSSVDLTTTTDVAVQALNSNTGAIFVSGTGIAAGGPGIRLDKNQAVTFSNVVLRGTAQPFMLKQICIAAAVNGEGANVTYTVLNPVSP